MNHVSRIAAGVAVVGVIATAGLAGGTMQANAAPARTTTIDTNDPVLNKKLCQMGDKAACAKLRR